MIERKTSLPALYGKETVQISEDLFKKTKKLLVETGLVSKNILNTDFFDYPFEHKNKNYSLTKIEEKKHIAIALYHMRAKGPFTRINMEEGFSIKIDLRKEKEHFPSAEITFSGIKEDEFINSQKAVEKVNKFLDRFRK